MTERRYQDAPTLRVFRMTMRPKARQAHSTQEGGFIWDI